MRRERPGLFGQDGLEETLDLRDKPPLPFQRLRKHEEIEIGEPPKEWFLVVRAVAVAPELQIEFVGELGNWTTNLLRGLRDERRRRRIVREERPRGAI